MCNTWRDETELNFPNLAPQPEPPLPPEATFPAQNDDTQQTQIDVGYVRDVAALLKPHRWEGYEQWIDYGIALKNSGGDLLKAVWKDCSKVSSDYNEEVADKKWAGFCQRDSNFNGKRISFGTVCRHAKEDDREGFAQKQLAGRSVQHRISFALQTGGSHVAVAKVMCAVLGEQYKATSATKGRVWSRFDGTRWKSDDDGQVLRDLTNMVYPLFMKEVSLAEQQVSGTEDLVQKEQWAKSRVLCAKVAKSLLDSNYRRSVIKEFTPLVQDSNFQARLDDNVNLLGFEDCVYDLATKEARAGRPEDYLSKSVGYPYPRESKDFEADIEAFLCKISPDPEVRNYLLDLLAQKLCGTCVKRVCIHTIIGADNGKTTVFEFLLEAMGEYGYKAKVQMFTRARPDANRADPELARLVGIRLLFVEEPDDGAWWNIQLLKEWSGGGTFSYRLNFENEIRVAPVQFMMHFACNDMIEVNGSDGGARNRLNKIDYRSRFVDGDSQQQLQHFGTRTTSASRSAFQAGPRSSCVCCFSDTSMGTSLQSLPAWRVAQPHILTKMMSAQNSKSYSWCQLKRIATSQQKRRH